MIECLLFDLFGTLVECESEPAAAESASPLTGGARVIPVPGVTGMLRRLAKHYRLGLVSNTHHPPRVHELLQEMGLTGLMETVTLSSDVGAAKTAALFNQALDDMGVTAERAVYVGDSYENDYVGAVESGMQCYLIGRHARVPRKFQLRSILDLAIEFKTD